MNEFKQETPAGRPEQFFQFPARIIGTIVQGVESPGPWKDLGKSAQQVLPVLIFHSHGKTKLFPGRKRISELSGLSETKVTEGTKGIKSAGLVSVNGRSNGGIRTTNLYELQFRPNQGRTIIIDSELVSSGAWAKMSSSEKSLYMVIRYFAKPDPRLDPNCEIDSVYEGWAEDGDFKDYEQSATVHYCRTGKKILADFAGLSVRSFPTAKKKLIASGLVRELPNWIYECPLKVGVSQIKDTQTDPYG